MWIRLLKDVGTDKAGQTLQVEDATGRSYVAAGLAEDAGAGPESDILQSALTEIRTELAALVKGVGDTVRGALASLPRPSVIEPGESEAEKQRGWRDYMACVALQDGRIQAKGEERQAAGNRLKDLYKVRAVTGDGQTRAMAEGTGVGGGFTTGVQYESEIFAVMAEEGIIRPRASLRPLGARQTEWPALNQYAVPAAGQSAMFGGIQVFRKGENVARTESDPTFANIVLVAEDLTALVYIPRDLIFDSTANLDSYVPKEIGGALAWREDWEGFQGTGGSMLLGVFNAPATIVVTRAGGSGTATLAYADLTGMKKYMLPTSRKTAVWAIHPYMEALVEGLTDASGRLIYQPNFPGMDVGPAGVQSKMTLLGIPALVTEKVPAPGGTGDIGLFDFRNYLLGERSGVEIAMSDQYAFVNDQLVFRAKIRNDGQPALKKPITLADGSGTNQSTSFVVLK